MTTEASTSYSETNYDIYSETYIGKVPTKPYVIAARRTISPSGIITYEINSKSKKNYLHESIGKFWFSADGTYLFDSYGQVYRTEDLATFSDIVGISPIDNLKIESNYYYLNASWIDYSTNNLWVIYNDKIYQLDNIDYNVKNTLYPRDYFKTADNQEHLVSAQYVFAQSDESKLTVIEKVENTNTWLMEFIPVE